MELRNHFISVERPYTEGAVEVFEQSIRARQIKKAELVITALRLYEAEINGEKVGDALFTPGFTYYPKNLHFQRYDVTAMMTGCDMLKVYLAQGWYCGRYQNIRGARMEYYGAISEHHPTECIRCGSCERECPQSLPIRKLIREADDKLYAGPDYDVWANH